MFCDVWQKSKCHFNTYPSLKHKCFEFTHFSVDDKIKGWDISECEQRQEGRPTEEDLIVPWVGDEVLAVCRPVQMGDEAGVALGEKESTPVFILEKPWLKSPWSVFTFCQNCDAIRCLFF